MSQTQRDEYSDELEEDLHSSCCFNPNPASSVLYNFYDPTHTQTWKEERVRVSEPKTCSLEHKQPMRSAAELKAADHMLSWKREEENKKK